MEQQLTLGEGQIPQFVQHDEIDAGELVGEPTRPSGPGLGLQAVDQVDEVEEAGTSAATHAVGGDGDADVRLAGARPADTNSVALGFQEAAVMKVAHQDLVDRTGGEVELSQGSSQRQLGGPELVADGARLL